MMYSSAVRSSLKIAAFLPSGQTGGQTLSTGQRPAHGRTKDGEPLVHSLSAPWAEPWLWQQEGSSSIYTRRESEIRRLQTFYEFRNSPEIRRFLRTYPDLIALLDEARVYLEDVFGPSPRVALQVVLDPEVDSLKQLVAYIVTSLPVDEALGRLEQFDDEWFLSQLDLTGGCLIFNLEFA